MDQLLEQQMRDKLSKAGSPNEPIEFQGFRDYPLLFSAASCLGRSQQLILSHGADTSVRAALSGMNALDYLASTNACTEEGAVEMIEALLRNGADVRATDARGQTALHIAVITNRGKIGLCLLDHGADVNAQNGDGLTPLLIAASSGAREMVKLLLDHGADVNAKTASGQTVLGFCQFMEKEESSPPKAGRDFDGTLKILRQHDAQ